MLDFKISFDSLQNLRILIGAGWSSLVARRAHNPKVVGSNPAPATNFKSLNFQRVRAFFMPAIPFCKHY